MKKQLYVARPVKAFATALITSILLVVTVVDAKANHKADTTGSFAAINYIGVDGGEAVFNFSYLNTDEQKIILEIMDEQGELLFQRTYTDKVINKNIILKKEDVKCVVSFTIRIPGKVFTQSFELNSYTRYTKEVMVTALKG